MGTVNNTNAERRIIRWEIRDSGLHQFVKCHTIRSNFIAGNRLFRYIMKITGSRYISRGEITARVYECIIYLYLIIYIYKI